MFVEFSSDYCCDITNFQADYCCDITLCSKKHAMFFFIFFLFFFCCCQAGLIIWIELTPWLNRALLWYNNSASNDPMVANSWPLPFLWDAWFNQKTGNVPGIFKWLLLWYNEAGLKNRAFLWCPWHFFLFFVEFSSCRSCCQAVLIPTAGLNRAFNSASNGALGISLRRLVQRENKQCWWVL